MSAWYIFSALGFYPLDPVGGEYEIGSPIVKGAILRFGEPYAPATLEIRVKDYSPDRWRVRRVTLNGVELKDWRVRHADLVKGGVLEFEMCSDANGGVNTRDAAMAVVCHPVPEEYRSLLWEVMVNGQANGAAKAQTAKEPVGTNPARAM